MSRTSPLLPALTAALLLPLLATACSLSPSGAPSPTATSVPATPTEAPSPSPTPTTGPTPTPVDVFSIVIAPPSEPNAAAPLDIPTYDGSGQPVHPKVLYFADGWNGHRYWMSYEPYPGNDSRLENPSIVVSDDGIAWYEPEGIVNPVSGLPPTFNNGAHYSDGQLLMRGDVMELWFRDNYGQDPAREADIDGARIDRIVSTDGIHWTKPEVMLPADGIKVILSPVVLFENDEYVLWYVNFDNTLYRRTSKDGTTWTKEQATDLKVTGYRLWHQDIIHTSLGYEIVFDARAWDGTSNNLSHQELFYAMSPDGIHFTKGVKIITYKDSVSGLDNESIYRSSLVVTPDGYRLYYSARSLEKQWHVFLSQGPTISTLKGLGR